MAAPSRAVASASGGRAGAGTPTRLRGSTSESSIPERLSTWAATAAMATWIPSEVRWQ